MRVLTPDHLRREVLRLDMHDFTAPEIARRTGVNRSTVDYIIRRTRGSHKSSHRGNIKLVCDPAGVLNSGARFSADDLQGMIRLSGLTDGTLFEIARRDRSTYRAEMRGGELVRIGTGGVQ